MLICKGWERISNPSRKLEIDDLLKRKIMFKYILEGAGDINWMAIFALLTFFSMFVITAWVVLLKDKSYTDKMAHLPLEEANSINDEMQDHEK